MFGFTFERVKSDSEDLKNLILVYLEFILPPKMVLI